MEAETLELATGVVHRTAEVAGAEGRTVEVRIVPYGVSALANDGLGGGPRGVVYREEWMPGVFDHQLQAAHRVVANFEHQPGIGGIVAHGIALRSERDGFYGSFKVHSTQSGETALELINERVLTHVSLEARVAGPKTKNHRSRDGVVQRVKAQLMGIAFCRTPAYDGAEILAVREEASLEVEILDESLLPLAPNPELLKRVKDLGVTLPTRYRDTSDTLDASPDGDTSTG